MSAGIEGLRSVRDDDSTGLISLIGGCFAEYPGCVLDLPGIDAWLLAPASTYRRRGGDLWVLERGGVVVACAGYRLEADGNLELKSLYVGAAARREGLGSRLVGMVERVAADTGVLTVSLWTDTRFSDAHRLYERLGYARGDRTRELHDPSDTTEYFYRKELSAVAR